MELLLLGDVPAYHAARLGPDRWAVEHDGEVLTWGELADRSLRRAHALAAAGVRQDDIVALVLPNSNAFYELTFAAWKLGATVMAVSPRLPLAELLPVLELGGAKVIVADDPEIRAATGALPVDFGRDHADASPLQSLEARHWKAITSGGSTGRPKLIVDHMASRFPAGMSFSRVPLDGVMLNPAPLYHNFPFTITHLGLLMGCSIVGMTRFDAEDFLRLVDRRRVQWVNLVPTMMNRISRLPEAVRAAYDISALETVWHAAAPIPAWLKEMWIDWIGPEKIWETYGGTEGIGLTQIDGVEWLAHKGSVGRPQGCELEIRGEDGAPLPTGEIGEIYMRKQGAATYHYQGADSRRLPDGFESYGDFGSVDADGYLYLADRRTDLILHGGRNIYPAEVEAALMAHPQVETAIVIGLPDADMGASPHALIHTEPGAPAPSEEELRAFLADRLVGYKRPRSYEFTTQPLRDEAGKVRRSALRAERIKLLDRTE